MPPVLLGCRFRDLPPPIRGAASHLRRRPSPGRRRRQIRLYAAGACDNSSIGFRTAIRSGSPPPFFKSRRSVGHRSADADRSPCPSTPPVADVRTCSFQEMTTPFETRVAGIFAFWPLLAQLGFDELVKQAGYPGSEMVPATSALLSLLALKLIDKERRSHISDFNFDEALGLFAGLNVLPKTTFATDYSYRTVRENQQQLLAGWISRLLAATRSRARRVQPGLPLDPASRRGQRVGKPLCPDAWQGRPQRPHVLRSGREIPAVVLLGRDHRSGPGGRGNCWSSSSSAGRSWAPIPRGSTSIRGSRRTPR